MTFCSSRMLPGQLYCSSAPMTRRDRWRSAGPAARAHLLGEVIDQQRECLHAAPAAAGPDREDVEPVVEILAELVRPRSSARDRGWSPRRRGRRRAMRARAADALELALLQDAQQLRLHLQRQLADLVEEQRAAVGQLEAAGSGRDRAGERAPLVPEQLALEQRRRAWRRSSRATNGRSRAAEVVDRPRDELLAGARLAEDQHRVSVGATVLTAFSTLRRAALVPMISANSFSSSRSRYVSRRSSAHSKP